jgi:hypothetical protein
MAINQLIAQGIRPIGADLPQIGGLLMQKRQADAQETRQNALLQLQQDGFGLDKQRVEAQLAERGQAAQAQKREEARQWLTNNYETVAGNPEIAPRLIQFAKQRGYLPPDYRDDATIDDLAIDFGIQRPESPGELSVRNVSGFQIAMQGDRVLPGGVQAPQREPTGGAPGGRFGAPREGVNPDTGRVEFFVTDNAGNVRWLGATGAAGVNTFDREKAKDLVDAQGDVGRVSANARDMLNVLGQLERSQLGLVFGAASVAPTIPGTRQADAIALWEQINGKAFLEAFNSLKGGGQITEKEGEKATAAITRLSNRKQSPKAARDAIRELREVVTAGVVRARRKAEGGQQAAPSGNVVNFEDL